VVLGLGQPYSLEGLSCLQLGGIKEWLGRAGVKQLSEFLGLRSSSIDLPKALHLDIHLVS